MSNVHNMSWRQLMSDETQVPRVEDIITENKCEISSFERDYEEILFSSPFRRLQDKTQVFPLDNSDFIRTRLTHSLEVSTIARQLGIMLVGHKDFKIKFEPNEFQKLQSDIPSVLMCAGLLHDLGNPPFGHFGEDIIGNWSVGFFKNPQKHELTEQINTTILSLEEFQKNDLRFFEGNSQAFRLLSSKYQNPSNHALNLTFAVMSSIIKYPNSYEQSKIKERTKTGYFSSEKEIFYKVATTIGTAIDTEHIVRHPLAFLLEAADDIAYSTSDLEDAVKKNKVSVEQCIEYMKKHANSKSTNTESKVKELITSYQEKYKSKNRSKDHTFIIFQQWIGEVRRWMMNAVIYSFTKKYEMIMQGKYKQDLFQDTYHQKTIKLLKGLMKEYVFNAPDILKLELAAEKILTSLLNKFVPAILCFDDPIIDSSIQKSYQKKVDIISKSYRDNYEQILKKNNVENREKEDIYYRMLLITDFISSMTDSYAKRLYQELEGKD